MISQQSDNNTFQFKMNVSVDFNAIRALLDLAFGLDGISWAKLVHYQYPKGSSLSDCQKGGKLWTKDCDEMYENHPQFLIPFFNGGALILEDQWRSQSRYYLTKDKLLDGLKIIAVEYSDMWFKIANRQYDVNVANIYLQCCLFGWVIY